MDDAVDPIRLAWTHEEYPMKIAVLVKEVPDTYGDRKLDLETGLADRDASERILDEVGERSVEVALKYSDANPETEVVLVSMTPASAVPTIRKGLAMGAGSAVHVTDDALIGADLTLTAEVLAAALKHTGFDLVIGVGGGVQDYSAGALRRPRRPATNLPTSVSAPFIRMIVYCWMKVSTFDQTQ